MSDLNQRIEAMYGRDKISAWLLVALLWVTMRMYAWSCRSAPPWC
jgi:hypothetical protein